MWLKILGLCVGIQLGLWFLQDSDLASVDGKRVLITGASTGIGEQLAYHYARLGASVVITARRQHVLEKVVARCQELGKKDRLFDYVTADMSNLSLTKGVIQAAEKKLGEIDVLVLNHIAILPLGVWTGSAKNFSDLDLIIDTNFKAYIHLASYAMSALERSHGSLVVVSSLAGKIGQPFVAAYSASKFALEGFFNSWRQEMKIQRTGVSVTVCVIGLIGTENAMANLLQFGSKFLLSIVKPASPADTALAIVTGAARGDREVYFPYLDVRLPQLVRDWIPELIDSLIRYLVTPDQYRS